MAITPQHEKGEPTEADLEKAYNKAQSIGLFLVEKYARQLMREDPQWEEFIVDANDWGFRMSKKRRYELFASGGKDTLFRASSLPLSSLIQKWNGVYKLTSEPMRFTADGPVRREW